MNDANTTIARHTLALLSILTVTSPCHAVERFWNGGVVGAGNWTDSNSWSNGVPLDSTVGDTAWFRVFDGTLGFDGPSFMPDINSNRNIEGVLIGVPEPNTEGAVPFVFTGLKLTLGAGGIDVSEGSLDGDGSHQFNNSEIGLGGGPATWTIGETTTINAVISGVHDLRKDGVGVLILTKSNTYTGDTIVDAGTLVLTSSGRIHDDSDLVVNSGAAFVTSAPDAVYSLNGDGVVDIQSGANFVVGNFTEAGGTGNFSGTLNGMGQFSKRGSGTLTISGDMNHRGPITVQEGRLIYDTSVAFDNDVTVSAGAVLELHDTVILDSLNGAGIIELNLDAVEPFGVRASGVFSGAIQGIGGFSKYYGSGTLTLSGTNTYSGETNVRDGTLQLGALDSLPATTDVILDSAATLDLDSFNQHVNRLFGEGTIELGSGTLSLANGGTPASVFSGVINGTGGLTVEGGVLRLSGTNTYTGPTTLNGGLQLDASNVLSDATDVIGVGTLNLQTHTDTVNSLTLVGPFSKVISSNGTLSLASTGTALTLINIAGISDADTSLNLTGASGGKVVAIGSQGGASTMAGPLDLGSVVREFEVADANYYLFWNGVVSGTGGINKTGPGTLQLDGTNTYSGPTTIEAGRLIGNTGSLPNTSITNNSELEYLQIGDGTRSASITGPGDLIKTGSGKLALTTNQLYTGDTIVSAGTLLVDGGGRLNDMSDLVVNAGATFQTDVPDAIYSLNDGPGGGGTVELLADGGFVVGNTNNSGGTGFFSGLITGPGTLEKRGLGTLTLTGANNYSGATTLRQGTLLVNNTSGSGTGAGDLTVRNAALLGGTGSISGNVFVESGGTISPGLSPGMLTLGSVDFATGSILDIEIGGTTAQTEYDVLDVTGTATLDGLIEVSLGGFSPPLGQQFTVLTASDITNNGLALSGSAANLFRLLVGDDSVILKAISGQSGDYNNNGTVDAADYTVWRNNLGAAAGTLDNDPNPGPISTAQYATWKANYGAPLNAAAVQFVNVPEPCGKLLLSLGCFLALVGFRRSGV